VSYGTLNWLVDVLGGQDSLILFSEVLFFSTLSKSQPHIK